MAEDYIQTSGEALLKIREWLKNVTPFPGLAFIEEVKEETNFYILKISLAAPGGGWTEKTVKISRSYPFNIEMV